MARPESRRQSSPPAGTGSLDPWDERNSVSRSACSAFQAEPAQFRKAVLENRTLQKSPPQGRLRSEQFACAVRPDAPSGSCRGAPRARLLSFVLCLLRLTRQPLCVAGSIVLSESSTPAFFASVAIS